MNVSWSRVQSSVFPDNLPIKASDLKLDLTRWKLKSNNHCIKSAFMNPEHVLQIMSQLDQDQHESRPNPDQDQTVEVADMWLMIVKSLWVRGWRVERQIANVQHSRPGQDIDQNQDQTVAHLSLCSLSFRVSDSGLQSAAVFFLLDAVSWFRKPNLLTRSGRLVFPHSFSSRLPRSLSWTEMLKTRDQSQDWKTDLRFAGFIIINRILMQRSHGPWCSSSTFNWNNSDRSST